MYAVCAHIVSMSTLAVPLASRSKAKDTRFFARISSSDKELIEQAAAISGQSVAAFVITQAREVALELVKREQVLSLNLAESRRLVDALLAPPKAPNQAFRDALADYRRTVISDVNPDSPIPTARRASRKKAVAA